MNSELPPEVLKTILKVTPKYDTSLDQRLFYFVIRLESLEATLNNEDRLASNSCSCRACKSAYPEKISELSGPYCPGCYMELTFDLTPESAKKMDKIPGMPVISMKSHRKMFDGIRPYKRRNDDEGLMPAYV